MAFGAAPSCRWLVLRQPSSPARSCPPPRPRRARSSTSPAPRQCRRRWSFDRARRTSRWPAPGTSTFTCTLNRDVGFTVIRLLDRRAVGAQERDADLRRLRRAGVGEQDVGVEPCALPTRPSASAPFACRPPSCRSCCAPRTTLTAAPASTSRARRRPARRTVTVVETAALASAASCVSMFTVSRLLAAIDERAASIGTPPSVQERHRHVRRRRVRDCRPGRTSRRTARSRPRRGTRCVAGVGHARRLRDRRPRSAPCRSTSRARR